MNTDMFELLIAKSWENYELLDSGDGERLERYGKYITRKPDPEVLWKKLNPKLWDTADFRYRRTAAETGSWQKQPQTPEHWTMKWGKLTCSVKPTPFKHTGIFPEQTMHWEWMKSILEKRKTKNGDKPKVLNLFAYTGLASVVCAQAGAFVTHVDASKPSVGWAKYNQTLSRLPSDSIRWILDDVMKFIEKEVRRGSKYDAIILDPPVYGHGPHGERWSFKEHVPILLNYCNQLLSDTPLFVLMNAYAVSTSPLTLRTVVAQALETQSGATTCGELAIQEANSDRILSTGKWVRWEAESNDSEVPSSKK